MSRGRNALEAKRSRERKKRAKTPITVSVDPTVPTEHLATRLLKRTKLRSREAAESLSSDAERLDRALCDLEVARGQRALTEDEYRALAALTSGKR
ncbi:MAG: hypothetical protein HYV07_34230, partial [Deltaproteobacteria bacterium]|nr:hypothetical protein [Deltaproteobacteria bacterium]